MTTEAIPIYSDRETTFYVPHFEVRLQGRRLPGPVVHDVMQVTYRDNVDEIDSFELTINNWDADNRQFKYEPASDTSYAHLFNPGKRLELWMGYLHNLRMMLRGEITTLEPNYPGSGGSTLSVRGLNVLHQFRTEQHTYAWEATPKMKRPLTDSWIAEWLGSQPRQAGKPGLGIPVRLNEQAAAAETPQNYVFMNNQFDIVFLMERARHHGYEVVLRVEEKDGKTVEVLYFGPSDAKYEPPTYRLEWGKSLISLRPTLSTVNQISEVVVRGWDRQANKPIEKSAKWQDLFPASSPERARMERLAQAFGNRRQVIVDQPVHTAAQAEKLAKDTLKDQLKTMVQASAATVGLPDLRAGRKVEIIGFGLRLTAAGKLVGSASDFDGVYYVTQSTHTIGDSGYRTTFEARREEPIPIKQQGRP